MKFFEFRFNPKGKEYTEYESFCYQPRGGAEKCLGYLCVAGELTNTLPPNRKLMQVLAERAKEKYYSPTNANAEAAIQDALAAINSHLESESKKGNIGWLGNLSFVILAVARDNIYLGKIGNLKIILGRESEALNLAVESAAYASAAFSNIISGKLLLQDKIFILTNDLFEFLELSGMMQRMINPESGHEEKYLRELFKGHEKQLKNYSGFMLLLVLNKITKIAEKRTSVKFPAFKLPGLRLPQPKILLRIPIRVKNGGLAKTSEKEKKKIIGGKRRIVFGSGLKNLRPEGIDKKIALIGALILILAVGFVVARVEKQRAENAAQKQLLQVQQKTWQAQNYIVSKKEAEANKLFQEALTEITSLESSLGKNKTEKIKSDIEGELEKLNKIQIVDNVTPLFSLDTKELSAQKLIFLSDMLYGIDNENKIMYAYSLTEDNGFKNEIKWPFNLAAKAEDFLVFYNEARNALVVRDGEELNLQLPYPEFRPSAMTGFGANVFFMDNGSGEIIKYPLSQGQTLISETWLVATSDTTIKKAVDFAVDGSIWILSQNGTITRFWGGLKQGTITPDFWPKLTEPTRIITGSRLKYLYALDPSGKRIIILDKKGALVAQYQSAKFNALKDFAVDDGGKNIYLLNGSDIYKISL